MERGTEFLPSTMLKRVAQYNSKHCPTPKLTPVDWKNNSLVTQHCYKHASRPARPDIKCTDPISVDQQPNLSDILSSFNAKNYF